MLNTTMPAPPIAHAAAPAIKSKRIESIDLLRGTVMIIMALDHVRDYFHADVLLFSPTDLTRTNVVLFFTRLITHYCAPVFVFLAGASAHLYGTKKDRKQLSFFLLTRGIWLVFAELFIVTLEWTFNPLYHYFSLQVIWAIGISMIALSAIVYLNKRVILAIGIIIVAGHNLLDTVHVPGKDGSSFLWALLHEPGDFRFGHYIIGVRYPVLAWIGIISLGYCFGSLFAPGYDPAKRKKILLALGLGAIVLFIILRAGNFYGDPAPWSVQNSPSFSLLSFLNVTKYPPSLLYTLMTLGPAILFLAFAERPLNAVTARIQVFGRVPMFYYLAHIFVIHVAAMIAAVLTGYKWTDMVLLTRPNAAPELKGYGFNLFIVYLVWAALILFLYPFCKWFDRYKRANQAAKPWLSYL